MKKQFLKIVQKMHLVKVSGYNLTLANDTVTVYYYFDDESYKGSTELIMIPINDFGCICEAKGYCKEWQGDGFMMEFEFCEEPYYNEIGVQEFLDYHVTDKDVAKILVQSAFEQLTPAEIMEDLQRTIELFI